MEVIIPTKRLVPEELDITLTEEAKLIIEIMTDDEVKISCDTITDPRYWLPQWRACPLCGATRGKDGLWVHQGAQ